MAKNLVIVESPAKAKTIARYLGKDFKVKSSFGHIRDLPKKDFGVDIKKDFEPTYEISDEKQKVVKDLKSAAKSREVWLASDEDREGEAIAWHVAIALGLKPDKTKRIVFHEITEPAITAAVKNPRTIDKKLVDAQQARRILDRLVGYELSPVLWKKIRAGLSAGRVQSVAVRLIVEREREIKDFKPESSFKVSAVFETGKGELAAELVEKLKDVKVAKEFLSATQKATFTVASIEQKPGKRSPGPPFITSTLQQEAARRLGFSVKQTMTLAQRLYEEGHITYMRTDSTSMSPLAINAAKAYVTKTYGAKYSEPRQYQTKDQSAQQAHEAIRPTDVTKPTAGRESGQKKLYELIWRRMVASQMASANVQKTEILIDVSGRKEQFLATGEVLSFDGFFKVYGGSKEDQILPEVKKGQKLTLQSINAIESLSRPPARYSEGSLVKKLEELGIGRPSTYAPTISTVQDRGYVEKKDLDGESYDLVSLEVEKGKIVEQVQPTIIGADRAKLTPTQLAELVTDFLIKYFAEVVDYDFTAKAEKDLDEVEEGKISWQNMLKDFYKQFHPLVEKSKQASRAEAVQMRELGKDPKTGLTVSAKFGRFGPVLQLGEAAPPKSEEAKKLPKPKFAPLPEGKTLDDVTLEEALPMFNLPRTVGKTTKGEDILADVGPYGPYLKVGKDYTSIKDLDPMKISEAEARKVLEEKAEVEAKREIADFGEVKVLRGPYGPYVTNGKKNARIPKTQDPEKLDEKSAREILDKATDKNNRRGRRNRNTAAS